MQINFCSAPITQKMPLAPRPSASCVKMQTTLSTWTPLNHPLVNSKVTSTHLNTLISQKHVINGPNNRFYFVKDGKILYYCCTVLLYMQLTLRDK